MPPLSPPDALKGFSWKRFSVFGHHHFPEGVKLQVVLANLAHMTSLFSLSIALKLFKELERRRGDPFVPQILGAWSTDRRYFGHDLHL